MEARMRFKPDIREDDRYNRVINRLGTTVEQATLAARGENQSAFDERRILAACVAPSSNTGGILSRRALSTRRLARLGATPDFHHGLLDDQIIYVTAMLDGRRRGLEHAQSEALRLQGEVQMFESLLATLRTKET